MKNKPKIIFVILVLIIIGTFIYFYKINQKNSIKGCYVAHLAKDVYTLEITSQQGDSFQGTLDINNYEKDSSTGTLKGTYNNGILLADYTFLSEGIISVGPVIFKKSGNAFIRGYGPTNEAGDSFPDINNIKFDSSVVYNLSKEGCSTSIQ